VGARTHERPRPQHHGLGLTKPPWRLAYLVLAAIALVAGVAGGLARLGLAPPTSAAAFHGALMVSGFLGTVISLERAVALGMRLAYAAPLAAGAGTLAMLAGLVELGTALWIAAPLALFGASVAIVLRQRELHTVLLAVAPLAWLAGSVLFLVHRADAAPACWFAFLVITIAAERLEMTRLRPRRAAAAPLLVAAFALLGVGATVTILDADTGRVIYGLALFALAAWLALFDVARSTVRLAGFARYSAFALLAGYGWLAAGGLAWALAPQLRDLALHAIGIGFVFSMILAHAPLIVPVIARIRMRYVPGFYAPLALLHLSLLLRVGFGPGEFMARAWGGALNAAALVLFMATLAYSIATRDRGSGDAAPAEVMR
jgi:hypothetical protein